MKLHKLDHIPAMKSMMTPFPYSIDIDESLSKAEVIMNEHGIRHLPVTDNGRLVSLITDRDIKQSLEPKLGLPPEKELSVRDASVVDAYVVNLNEPLDVVLMNMAELHIGCTLITKDGRLAGVFTTTDACRCFGEMLRDRFPNGPKGGHEAA